MPGPTGLHHVVHADDRDADYDIGMIGGTSLFEPQHAETNF